MESQKTVFQKDTMDSKKCNKITEIVKLRQILKRWRKLANSPKSSSSNNSSSKSIKFLKKTLSFSDNSFVSSDIVPKGFLAVCVGKELKRFVIPTEYLGHPAFGILLREAEEEFGFQQAGILRIPCQVSVFESILKVVEEKEDLSFMQEYWFTGEDTIGCRSSSESQLITRTHHQQSPMCR